MTVLDWLGRFLSANGAREIRNAERILRHMNRIDGKLKSESDDQLQSRAKVLREQAANGVPLANLMVETYALVREVAFRKVGMRHYDVQVLGGVALHGGNIVEMKTGEGKTLAATMPVVLNALSGKGAHVVTVNDYLAERDARWMAPIYDFMGLSVGLVTEDMDDGENRSARKAAYGADITYVTNHELVFDYLRDNLAVQQASQVHRPLNFALVDEVDLLFLDEAGTPLIISGEAPEVDDLSVAAHRVVSSLKERSDFRIDHKSRQVLIEDAGWQKMEKALGIDNLAAPEHIDWQHALHYALLAHAVYQRDVDYIVDDGEILLIDDFTGRVSPDKRYSDGLHQALEAKEGVAVQQEHQTLAKVSYQMFFRQYPALCGMTGTAYSAREEFGRTYNLNVVVIPGNRPNIRKDAPSIVFSTSAEKFDAVAKEVDAHHALGRPVLIGTTSVKESEQVSRLLSTRNIPHTVLNAKDDSAEAEIIAQAGRPAAVTVSTNMAGRGVDIILGGNVEVSAGDTHSEKTNQAAKQNDSDRRKVMDLGGLMIIGTGLHESRRIDDQLRGRAGRQGEPGGTRFFLSLDDPVYKKFGERGSDTQVLAELRMQLKNHPPGQPITDQRILKTLHNLRKKIEVENAAIRREVLRYDMVVDHQRRTIYDWRQTILSEATDGVMALLEDIIDDASEIPTDTGMGLDLSNLEAHRHTLEKRLGKEQFAIIVGQIMLTTIDTLWTAHLNHLESIDDAVGLRGYAQMDPLIEYKREAHELYLTMLNDIRAGTLTQILSLIHGAEPTHPSQITLSLDESST